ncbi:BTB/POZ domain-containing protein 6-B-like [Sitodiplosis mosellana]|uniref:BTB/POZ domain-containing protein 6-B-like n=1 Tax=Sitodiplosis mosellana TaxID=263140 RepID=UPI00244525B0|nr:BTB/POZ domain-containing protein 6-B-like [Sitodiplosis mosellana]
MASVLKNTAALEACQTLYLNEEFADVRFVFNVDDKSVKVPANKVILSVLSPVFKAMFFGSLKEGNEVPIEDADPDAFEEFLQLFYLGEVTLTMENIETVVRLADKYDVLEHVNACAVLLKSQLTLDNMCFGYQLALTLKNEELIKFCEGKITNLPKEVFASDAFKRCDKDTLERILELNFMCKEIDIFDACLTWAKHACEQNDLNATQSVNLRSKLGDFLKLIRFGAMTNEEFGKKYMLHKGLFTLEELEDIMLSLSVKEYEPKIFNQISRLR